MTWREDLRRVEISVDGRIVDAVGASFRGVPFFVEESSRTGGRRVVVHEFPFRPDPFIEDLDRRARKFPVTGYVIGDDYMVQRDKLLAALEDEDGPGQLVHPYYGVKSAICDTLTVRETSRDGGMATFAIDFIEAPAQSPSPTIDPDLPGKVATSAAAAHAAIQGQFATDFDPAGLPAFALASAETALNKATAVMGDKFAPLIADAQELASFNGRIAILSAQSAALVRQPLGVVGQFLTAISGIGTTAAAVPGAIVNALVDAYNADLGILANATTSTRARELANQLAITSALRRTMAIEAARLVPTVPFASIDDATAARDTVAGMLDDQAQTAGDTAYPALVTLRSDVLRAVPGSSTFARVIAITRRTAIPSLLLAYQLYGSVDQEPDVIARNRVRHPGFIAGELGVLSSGG